VKALIAKGDGALRLANDVPEPEIGPYDCRVRVEAFAFCNATDQTIASNRPPLQMTYPAILGHESVGRVTDVGAKVRYFRVGQRVLRPYAAHLGETLGAYHTAWGGFAEVAKVIDLQAMRDDGQTDRAHALRQMSYQQPAPTGLEPAEALLAIPWKEIVSALDGVTCIKDQQFLIAGAGLTAVCFGVLLRLQGAARVTLVARRPDQLAYAQQLGAADDTLSPTAPANAGPKYDAMIDTTGSIRFLRSQLPRLTPGGRVYAYAIYPELATDPKTFADLERDHGFVRIDPSEVQATDRVAAWIAEGQLPCEPFISHRFGLDDWDAAWQTVTNKQTLKTIVYC